MTQQAFEGYPGTWEEHLSAARRNGLCEPKPPVKVRQRHAYCAKTGKRIRDLDGFCNGCVKYGPEQETVQ